VLQEEQLFREGAENWTFGERVRSCAVFGTCHFYNLIVPICILPGLAFAGVTLMAVYLSELKEQGDRQAAVIETAITHRAYNTFAFWLWGIVIMMSFIGPVIHWIG
jgi:hypothetical protein